MTETATTGRVFRLKMLDVEEPSRYLLSVYSPGPFNTSRSLFMVDSLAYDPNSHQYSGLRDSGEVVVAFHDSYTYMLVNKDLYDVISMDEAKKMMEQEEGEPEASDPSVADNGLPKAAYK